MNKITAISIVLGSLVVLGGIAWIARPTGNKADLSSLPASHNVSATSAPAGMMKGDEDLFDFGTISMANGKVTYDFKITNTSDQPITIGKIYTSCMCTSAFFKFKQDTFGPFGMEGMGGSMYLTQTVNPGESGIVQAVYDPAAHGPAGVGAIDRFIYVEDKNGNQTKFKIKANVTP